MADTTITITGTMPEGDINQAYAFTPTTSGGSGTYTYTATGLVAGLSIDASTGKVSGVPTATASSSSVTITATDSDGATGTYTGSLTIYAAITINYADTAGYTGTALSITPTISGGSGTYTYSATNMAQGLAIDTSTGIISGTPTTAGTQKISVTVSDNLGASVLTTATVTIQTPVTLSGSPGDADVNTAYTFTPTITAEASGGTVTVSRTAGSIPDGLTLDATTGAITGTPTTTGSSTFTLKISDGTSTSSTTFTIKVVAWISLSGNPDGAIVGKAFTFTPTVTSGGAGTITYTATGLASWMTIDAATGTITGTPSAAGTTNIAITATDGTVSSSATAYAITSANGLSVTGNVGTVAEYADVSYTPTITGVANAAALSFTLSTGALPAGLTIDSTTGTITGEATATGSFSVTYSVTDGVTTTTWTSDITVITHVVLSVSLPDTAVGAAFTYSMTGSGGDTTAYVYAASGLPANLTLDTATGVISGKPTTKGSYTVDWSLTDGVSTSSGTGTLVVGDPITITGTPPTAYIGAAYTFTPTISNAYTNGTLGVTLTTGKLPDGLVLNVNTGVISGTPTTEGAATFTLTASDNRTSDAESFTLTVDKAVSVSGTPAEGEVNTAYTFTPTITNAAGTVTVTVDQLPPGLSIDATTGAVTGTPTASGTTASVITVTDGHTTATLSVSFKIASYIEITGTPDARYISKAFTFTPTVTGGESGSYAYSISDLPDSTAFPLSLDTTTGAISGTPTASGTYSVKYTVTDGIGSATVTIDLSVAAFSFTGTAYEGVIAKSYRFIPTLVGGTGSYTVSVSTGTLPDGLVLDTTTGVISGKVSTMGDTAVTLSATDSLSTQTLAITLSFTDRVVYAIAHRPEHYDPSSTYSTWTESDSSEVGDLGYVTTSPGGLLTVNLCDSKSEPTSVSNISIYIHAKYLWCTLCATGSVNYYGLYTSATFAYAYATFTTEQLKGFYITRLRSSTGVSIVLRHVPNDTGVNLENTPLQLGLYLEDASGEYSDTGARFTPESFPAYSEGNSAADAPVAYSITSPTDIRLSISDVGSSSAKVVVRIAESAVSTITVDLSTVGTIYAYDFGQPYPTPTNIAQPLKYCTVPLPIGINTSNWVRATSYVLSTSPSTAEFYYTAAASYKLNKTELYEDKITGLATTVAQFTGDVTEFTNNTPNYNDYHGRYASQAGQTDSYTFVSRTSDVGYEPKAVMITAYANTDDDDTKASLSAAAVSSDGTVVKQSANAHTVSSDGTALNYILQKDPITGDLWDDAAVNGNTFGVTRTE